MFKKSKEIADNKVDIAVNTYEMIDKHIRKLDSDLAKFESEMKVIIDWSKALLAPLAWSISSRYYLITQSLLRFSNLRYQNPSRVTSWRPEANLRITD